MLILNRVRRVRRLAKKVYHEDRVRRHFECFAWRSVSQQFNIRALVQEILINLMPPLKTRGRKLR